MGMKVVHNCNGLNVLNWFPLIRYRLRSKRLGKGGIAAPIKVVTSSALSPSEHQQLAAVAKAAQDKMLAKVAVDPEMEQRAFERIYVPPG